MVTRCVSTVAFFGGQTFINARHEYKHIRFGVYEFSRLDSERTDDRIGMYRAVRRCVTRGAKDREKIAQGIYPFFRCSFVSEFSYARVGRSGNFDNPASVFVWNNIYDSTPRLTLRFRAVIARPRSQPNVGGTFDTQPVKVTNDLSKFRKNSRARQNERKTIPPLGYCRPRLSRSRDKRVIARVVRPGGRFQWR